MCNLSSTNCQTISVDLCELRESRYRVEVCKIKTLDLVLQGSCKNMGSDEVLLAFLRYDIVSEDKKNSQGDHLVNDSDHLVRDCDGENLI